MQNDTKKYQNGREEGEGRGGILVQRPYLDPKNPVAHSLHFPSVSLAHPTLHTQFPWKGFPPVPHACLVLLIVEVGKKKNYI